MNGRTRGKRLRARQAAEKVKADRRRNPTQIVGPFDRVSFASAKWRALVRTD